MTASTKPRPWKCSRCRELAVVPTVLPLYRAVVDHDGTTFEVEIPDYQVFACARCGETVLDDAAEARLADALRSAAGLLEPAAIRARRLALELTEAELADLLQVPEATLSRLESGGQVQSRAVDRLMRAFFDLAPLRDYLKSLDSAAPSSKTTRSLGPA